MSEYVIKSHCHINTNRESDTFVGLDCRNEELTVNFPLGYQLSDNDSGIRKRYSAFDADIGTCIFCAE